MPRKPLVKNHFLISDFYCTKCGQHGLSIPRSYGHYKEPGHLKKLYCPHCKNVWNHVEIRPFYSDYSLEDFKLEMQYHNFDNNGNRKKPYRIFRGYLRQGEIYNG
jgi:hypothetical protein